MAKKPRTAEHQRLADSKARKADWKNWGPYVSDRAWGTVREDYSAGGTAWEYFPHDHARSRAYRWNEDGLAGFCNRFQNICLAVALWMSIGAIAYRFTKTSMARTGSDWASHQTGWTALVAKLIQRCDGSVKQGPFRSKQEAAL